MIIKVTQEHINKGVRKDAYLCPIALACKESGLDSARVTSGEIMVNYKVYGWIQNFDFGEKEDVKPFEFEV